MKLRQMTLADLAACIAEITLPFNEKTGKLLQVHFIGPAEDVRMLVAAVATNLLGTTIIADAFAKGVYVSPGIQPMVAFVDETSRKDSDALPPHTQAAKGGILMISRAGKNILVHVGAGTTRNIKTNAALKIRIARRKKNEDVSAPPRVKISAGGLPKSVHKAFKTALKPRALIV